MPPPPDAVSASAALAARARAVMPGGQTRLPLALAPHPPYAVRGEGARVLDADGVWRIDFVCNFMTLLHGHAHPAIVEAVVRQAERGFSFSLPTEADVKLAEHLCGRVASFERVRFCNSGTEAGMLAIKAARAFTGRSMIAKCEGLYHGSYDPLEIAHDSTPANWGPPEAPAKPPYASGTPKGVVDDVLVLPYNDTEACRALIEAHAARLAAVVVDPVPPRLGFVAGDPDWLASLRALCLSHGIVLVFDEVACFRLAHGGVQGRLGIRPDLTMLGKVIGGGLPAGALAGSAKVMSVFDQSHGRPTFPHGGTFNANPMSMVAGLAALERYDQAAVDRLNAMGESARRRLEAVVASHGFDAQITGEGSLLRLQLGRREVRNHRDLAADPDEPARGRRLQRLLLDAGVLTGSNGMLVLSTVHGEAEIEALAGALDHALPELRRNDPSAA